MQIFGTKALVVQRIGHLPPKEKIVVQFHARAQAFLRAGLVRTSGAQTTTLERLLPLDDADENEYDGYHQQNMDEPADGEYANDAKEPKD